jgi:peptidoglycan-associated lipoprotein
MTQVRNRAGALFVGSCLLVLLTGCSGKTVTATAQDRDYTPGQGFSAAPAQEETRVTEQVASAQKESVQEAAARPEALSLADIFFDYDRFTIRDDAQGVLEGDARLVKTETDLNKGLKLMIEGYCDERGTLEYNLVLGQRRAQAVKQYLQNLGIPASQIQVTSYGKEKPFCTEHTYECWQMNRRAHLLMQ